MIIGQIEPVNLVLQIIYILFIALLHLTDDAAWLLLEFDKILLRFFTFSCGFLFFKQATQWNKNSSKYLKTMFFFILLIFL